jgi:hypothetical protein
MREPYFRVLPEKYNTILYFTDEEMEALRGSALYGMNFHSFVNRLINTDTGTIFNN